MEMQDSGSDTDTVPPLNSEMEKKDNESDTDRVPPLNSEMEKKDNESDTDRVPPLNSEMEKKDNESDTDRVPPLNSEMEKKDNESDTDKVPSPKPEMEQKDNDSDTDAVPPPNPDLLSIRRASIKMRHLIRSDTRSDFVCSCCYELMVEPTTLMCGHNFCRLCLANWTLASKKKECPVCREVWQENPKVNIALRNVEHKMLGEKISTREKEVLSDEHGQEKIREYDQQNKVPIKEEKTETMGSVLSGIYTSLGVFLIGYLVWYWRNSDENLLIHKPTVRWKTSDVVTWMRDMDWAEEYKDIVHQKGIDGPMLLSLDEDTIDRVLNLTNPVHKRALLIAIQDVRDKGVKMPGSVWEYRALYPGRSVFLLYGFKDFPRGTLFHLYMFNYEDVFLPFLHFTTTAVDDGIPFNWSQPPDPTARQWVMFLMSTAMIPYCGIGQFAWSLFSGQFWTPFIVMVSCPLLILTEVAAFMKCSMRIQWRTAWPVLRNYLKLVFTAALMSSVVCPNVPRLVCDCIFYANLYYIPIQQVKHLYDEVKSKKQ